MHLQILSLQFVAECFAILAPSSVTGYNAASRSCGFVNSHGAAELTKLVTSEKQLASLHYFDIKLHLLVINIFVNTRKVYKRVHAKIVL